MSLPIRFSALCFLLAGCATATSDPGGGALPTTGGGELTILDYMDTHLPRESYIAKFEIIPELGVSLLYPTLDDEPRKAGPGTHRLPYKPSGFVQAQRERYQSRITGLLNQAPPRITEVTMLVVVSDQPLDLDLFLRAPSGIRDQLGQRAYINEIWAVEEILRTVIPDPATANSEHRVRPVRIPSAWMIRG